MKPDSHHRPAPTEALHDVLWRLAGEYAFLVSETSRTSVRAELLQLLDRIPLPRPSSLTTRRVMAWELTQHHRLLGAIRLQLDLGSRASMTSDEIIMAAQRGIVRIAMHPTLPSFPIGVAVALPSDELPTSREALFGCEATVAQSRFVIPCALATNPTLLGGGRALINALLQDCAEFPSCPHLVTFSPLTGLRARAIQAADDDATDDELRDQLRHLLCLSRAPADLPRAAEQWLLQEAQQFAASSAYAAGNFHCATGGRLTGVVGCADRSDCGAMWMRAYFTYTTG